MKTDSNPGARFSDWAQEKKEKNHQKKNHK